jgi:SprT-like family
MVQCCFLEQYLKLLFFSVSKGNHIHILKKSNSSTGYRRSLSSDIIHRMKLRLSQPNEIPSEEEDDFDTSHYHGYVFRCQRKKGGSKPFQDEGHKGEHLSRWACHYIKASRCGQARPSQRQVTALEQFKNGSVRRRYLKDDKCSSQEAFSAFLEVFDGLFFFGSLHGRVTFKIVLSLIDCNLSAGTIACPVILSDGTIERCCEIQIIPINEANTLLSTLLHEMCHAFFLVYSCNTDGCFLGFKNCSNIGHGVAWQKVAAAIEACARQKLSRQLDLNRLVGLAMEIVIADEPFEIWQVHDLARDLGLDPDNLEQFMVEHRGSLQHQYFNLHSLLSI